MVDVNLEALVSSFSDSPSSSSKSSKNEFFSFLNKRQGLLDGVVVTGGEPCIHKDISEFVEKIKNLDTNNLTPLSALELLHDWNSELAEEKLEKK